MYRVYSSGVLIHNSVSPNPEVHLIDPSLTLIDSSAGTFTFTMAPTNYGYGSIQKFTSTIVIYQDNTIIWTGRVITQSDDFWKRSTFTCEGALAFLNDSQQPLQYYKNINSDTFFTTMIYNHNARVPSNRRFRVGMITMHDRFDTYKYKTEYKNTFDTIKENLFDKLGGHFRIRYDGDDETPIIDYLSDYPNTSSQQINFGENLLDFTRNWDLSDLCTVIIPRGKQLEEENSEGDKEYTTIASVNNNSIYLQNDTAVTKYGAVERVVDFSEVENPSTLKTLGTQYLQSTQFDDMVLNVSAVDLHMLNTSIRAFKLLDEVKCISAPHGLDRMFPITQIDIPLDKPDGVKYTMGNRENTSMSSQSVSSGSAFRSQLKKASIDTLADAKRNAARIINSVTTGYVNIITEHETSQALVITNTPDIADATRLWRFNLNGLGYSHDGGQTYDIAITMDGTIVADFIKTGVISDGIGYNYWNLETGAFQMAWNSTIANTNDDTITFVDLINLTDSNATNVQYALRRQSGTYNLLNGSNYQCSLVTELNKSKWKDGTWDGLTGGSAIKKLEDISGTPNPGINKGFKIIPHENNNPTYIAQRDVPLAYNQVYVMSCYVKFSSSRPSNFTTLPEAISYLAAGKKINATDGLSVGNSLDRFNKSKIPIDNKWHRIKHAFKTSGSAWTSTDKTENHARVENGKADIMFGFSGCSYDTCYIAGMTLERGNEPSDWSESMWDSSDFSKYTANEEVLKLDKALNGIDLFKRITNGTAEQGVYMEQKRLLINATYIKTGIFDAKLIRTGTITDVSGKTKWDLTNSKLSTRNIVITGGSISFGKMTMNSAGLGVGEDNVIKFLDKVSSVNLHRGLVIGSRIGVNILAPFIDVASARYDSLNVDLKRGYTGTFKTNIVTRVTSGGRATTEPLCIECRNGLIVGIGLSNRWSNSEPSEREMGIENWGSSGGSSGGGTYTPPEEEMGYE